MNAALKTTETNWEIGTSGGWAFLSRTGWPGITNFVSILKQFVQ